MPIDVGWGDDGIDMAALIETRFTFMYEIDLTEGAVAGPVRRSSFCRVYQRPEAV